MKNALPTSATAWSALAAAALLIGTASPAAATSIQPCTGSAPTCGIQLFTNAGDNLGNTAFPQYESNTGLLFTTTGGNGAFVPGSAGLGLTNLTLTATAGGNTSVAGANLANGTLHAQSLSCVGGCSATTEAIFMDTLHWTVAGGGSATITVSASVDGSVTFNPSNPDYANLSQVFFAGAAGTGDMSWAANQNGFGPTLTDNFGFANAAFSNQTLTGFSWSGQITVANGETTTIEDLLQIGCALGTRCDFLNTSALSFGTLPTGVGFTSDSGVFLTANTSSTAVPEPGSLVLMASGIAMAARRLRRQKK